MKKIITLLTVVFLSFSTISIAQQKEGVCTTSKVMNAHFKKYPEKYQEFLNLNNFTKNYKQPQSTLQGKSAAPQIIIPVVFHIYGRTQNGSTVTNEKIINSLNMVNEDFQGLNPDFDTVDPLFEGRKSKTNITFKLAAIDPNGNPTNGIIDHAAAGGQGNYNSPIVTQDAWDNYKYMNVYITADIHDDGKDNNSGIAWYPSKTDSDSNRARVVYNGRYLKGNTDDEFASILTHEFGHWLNLLHTFEGGCSSLTQDFVEDTPQEDKASNDDGCMVGATDCGDSLINYENYMGYDSSGGCAKMFTKGQTDRMYAALNHSARFPLWQNANLVATGTGGSLAVTPRMHDGNSWKENTTSITVCPGTNVKIGMQNVGLQNVTLIAPNGTKDKTPDGSTYWNINNAQESDAGTYLIKYENTNGDVGFGVVQLNVGFNLVSWLKINDLAWYSGNQIKACPGSNINIATPSGLPGAKSLRLPNGNLHTTPDNDGTWTFNNITTANAGVYTLIYDLGGCSYTTQVEVITENKLTPWVALNNSWIQRDFVEACVGERVHLGMQNIGLQNVTITGPNNFFDDTPDLGTGFEFASLTEQQYGKYTITWNDPASCSGSVDLFIRPKKSALDAFVRDNGNNWSRSNIIFACTGDNIALGTTNSLETQYLKLIYPNGSIDTTTDGNVFWALNNLSASDEGTYKIEYSNGQCYSETTILVKVGVEDLSNKIQYQLNNAAFTNASNNSLTINEGDGIRLKIPQSLFNGTIAWTGPNNFTSNANTIEITDDAKQNLHQGMYTATVTSTNGCNDVNATQTVNFTINFDGGTTDTEAPSAPTNLIASDITTTSVTLNWTASTDNIGVTNYEVFRGSLSLGLTSSTSYNVSGLSANTGYSFTVKAKDAAGNTSAESNQANITTLEETDTQAPTAPSNLSASNITTTSVDLNWTAATDNVAVTSYTIFQDNTSIGTSANTTFSVNNLTANTQYTFSVRANDAAGNQSSLSNTIDATTLNNTNPTPTYCDASNDQSGLHITKVEFGDINNTTGHTPYANHTNLSNTISSGDTTVLTVNLNNEHWTYNAVGVWIDWNNNGNFEDAGENVYSKFAAGPYNTNITAPSGLIAGSSLRMRVRAGYGSASKITPCGTDTYLGEVEDYTIIIGSSTADTQAPTIPSGLVASNISNTSLSLNWNPSTDNIAVTSYTVYRNTTVIGNATTNSFDVSNLTANTTYSFYVRANDAAGNQSDSSQSISVTTTNTNPPNDGNVVYVDMADVTVNSGNTWNPFQIEEADEKYFGPWYSGGAVRLVSYGKNVVCENTTSNVSFISDGVIIDANSNLRSDSHSFTVSSASHTSWNGKSGYIGFSYTLNNNTHYGWFYVTVSSNGSSITFKDYAYNTMAGEGLTTKRPTEQNKTNNSENVSNHNLPMIKSYPNPFNHRATIDVSSLGNTGFKLDIFDITGKQIYSKNYLKNPIKITIGEQIKATGVYFVKFQSNHKNKTLKIIKSM